MAKIFCIGFHKTGTNSLGEALTHLGYKVCGVRFDLIPSLEKGDYSVLQEIVESYDAFKDNPWPVLFKELDKLYPGSKFILTLRDEASWIRSIVNHFDSTPSEMIQYIYGQPFPSGHEDLFIQRFQKHNEEVLLYFAHRPEDLIVLDLEKQKNWNSLCEFLGKPLPQIPFPHVNKGAYTRIEKWKKIILRRIRARIGFYKKSNGG